MKLTKEILSAYLPYDVKVQYEGILNGNEISLYEKEFKKNHPNWLDLIGTYKPPIPKYGVKYAQL